MRRSVLLSPDAVEQLAALRARDRRLLEDAMQEHLGLEDATEQTRDRFRLRRPSPVAEFEIRVRHLRAFYRVVDDEVQVVLIGRKRGNALFVGRRRFVL